MKLYNTLPKKEDTQFDGWGGHFGKGGQLKYKDLGCAPPKLSNYCPKCPHVDCIKVTSIIKKLRSQEKSKKYMAARGLPLCQDFISLQA